MSEKTRFRNEFALIVVLVALTACAAQEGPEQAAVETPPPPAPAMESLVTVEWLNENLGDPDLVVLDCSVHIEMDEHGGLAILDGRPDFEAGHIPGAGFADLMGALADGDSEYRFAVPTPEAFAAAMEELGVGDDSRVVLYDSSNSAWAARVWWMLRWIGFDRAALLDGGLGAWRAAELPLSTEPADRQAGHLTVNLRPELIAERDEVLAAIDDPAVTIIDALSPQSFRGEVSLYERGGHIPGAVNVFSMSLLDETGRFRPQEELAALFEDDLGNRSIVYCGGGIAASADAFAMTRLGFGDVAVYAASLQEWAADPANPLVTGDE